MNNNDMKLTDTCSMLNAFLKCDSTSGCYNQSHEH